MVATAAPAPGREAAGYLFHNPEPRPAVRPPSIWRRLAADVAWLTGWCALAVALIVASDLR